MVTIPPIHCENGDRLFLDRMAWPTQRRSQWKDNSLNGCWITNRSSLISIYIYNIHIYDMYTYIYVYQSIEIWVWINLLKSELGGALRHFPSGKKKLSKTYLQLSRWQHQEPSRTWGHVSGWRQEGKPALSSQWRIMSLACRSHRGHVVSCGDLQI